MIIFLSIQLQVVEETSLYILSLEQKLLEKVQLSGLPDSLKNIKDSNLEEIKSDSDKFDVSDKSSNEDVATKNLDMKTFKSFLHEFAKQRIEKTIDPKKGKYND